MNHISAFPSLFFAHQPSSLSPFIFWLLSYLFFHIIFRAFHVHGEEDTLQLHISTMQTISQDMKYQIPKKEFKRIRIIIKSGLHLLNVKGRFVCCGQNWKKNIHRLCVSFQWSIKVRFSPDLWNVNKCRSKTNEAIFIIRRRGEWTNSLLEAWW